MSTYQLIGADDTMGVIRLSDNARISSDPNNSDWIVYLAWVTDGNTADVAETIDNPTTVTCKDFFLRFTEPEQLAVWTASVQVPAIGVGLTLGLSQGTIDLTSSILLQWMSALVSAGAISSGRKTTILTP